MLSKVAFAFYLQDGSLDISSPEISFTIPPTPDLLDLHDSYMVANVQIQRWHENDWVDVTAAQTVNGKNLLLYALFKGKWVWEYVRKIERMVRSEDSALSSIHTLFQIKYWS